MKRDDLEKLGLTAETIEKAGLEKDVIDKIMALHGKDIEGLKTKVETAEKAAGEIQNQLDNANKAIQDMKALDPEGLQKKANDWETKAKEFEAQAKQAKEEAETKVKDMQFDNALTEALKSAKVKDPKEILPHLDMDIIKVEDGKIKGLEEQLKPLQESKDYLFDSETPNPKIVTKTGSKPESMTAFEAAAMKGAGFATEKKE